MQPCHMTTAGVQPFILLCLLKSKLQFIGTIYSGETGHKLMTWNPDISLTLLGDKVAVRIKGGTPRVFYAPDFKGSIYEVVSPLISQLNTALNQRKNIKGREKAANKIGLSGERLFNALLKMAALDNSVYLDLFLQRAIQNFDNIPIQIAVIGDWYGLPWELLKLPKDWETPFGGKFLGEIASITGIIDIDQISRDNVFDVGDKLQIVSLAGNGLPHANGEIEFIKNIDSPNIRKTRVVEGLPRSTPKNLHHHNYHALIDAVNKPNPSNFLHGAFHSDTSSQQEAFSFILDKDASFTSEGFKLTGGRPTHPQIAFFNTCQGISPNAWFGGGVGVYALKRWMSDPVIASIAKINDKDATQFSIEFINRILPLSSSRGEEIGDALFWVRKQMFADTDPSRFLGFSYRILGNPKRYFQVKDV